MRPDRTRRVLALVACAVGLLALGLLVAWWLLSDEPAPAGSGAPASGMALPPPPAERTAAGAVAPRAVRFAAEAVDLAVPADSGHATAAPASPPLAPLELRVVDLDGLPVAGAVAWPASETASRWAEGDDDGVVPLPLPTDPRTLFTAGAVATLLAPDRPAPLRIDVRAPLHRRVTVDLSAVTSWPATVQLPPATVLDVVLDVPEPPCARLAVVVSAPVRLFEEEGERFQATERSLFDIRMAGSMSAGGACRFALKEEGGRHRFVGLRPAIDVRVEVQGPVGSVISDETLRLRPGEHRVHRITLDPVCWHLTGRVTDTRGQPVPGAEVWFWAVGEHEGTSWAEVTDEQGVYRLPHVAQRELDVRVTAEGFMRHGERLDLGRGARHDVQLRDARPFTITVREPATGRPAISARPFDTFSIWNGDWDPRDRGVWTSESFPDGAGVIELWCRDGSRRFPVAAGQRELNVELPDTGSVQVGAPAPCDGRPEFLVTQLAVEGLTDDELRSWRVRGRTLLEECPPGRYRIDQIQRDRRARTAPDRRTLATGEVDVRPGAVSVVHLTEVAGSR